MLQLDRNVLSVALASALLLAASAARAQSQQDTGSEDTATNAQAGQDATQAADDKAKNADGTAKTLETVTVTGIRRGIEDAIETKQSSTSIVEAISAEDIGKLPDVSIAESIARLPGLTAQRVAGRAQVISVRGLSPDFATTLLNGREVVSTGDNRSVEFDQYPSELVNGVTVYKTPDASLVGQGLSGTIDIKSARPLSYNERVIAVSGRYQRNSLGDAANVDPFGNRINVSYIGQFADRTFGVAFGYSHSDMPIGENQVGLYEPWKDRNDDGTPLNRPGLPDYTFSTDGIKALRRTGNLKRDAALATLQYRPSNAWTSTLDMFHSEAEQEDTANQFEINTQFNGSFPCNPACQYSGPVINGNNTFTGGTLANVSPLVRGLYNKRKDEINAFGWSNEFSIGQARIFADVSYSKAKRDELNLENNAQLAPVPQFDTVNLSYRQNGFSQLDPGLDYSNPGTLFLTNTIYGSGYGKVPSVEDELKGFKLVASLPAPGVLSWFSDIDVGLNYADRQKDKRQPEGNILLGPQGDTTIADDLQYDPVNLGFAGIGYIPSWNVPGAVARYMIFNPTDDQSFLIAKAWTVQEKIGTGFVKANIDTEWAGIPVRGNVGVQVQHTDQSSDSRFFNGLLPAGQQIVPISGGKTFNDVLPSLNLGFSFPDDQVLRFALARQLVRARVDQLRASLDFGVDTSTGIPGASSGNPELDPWRANALDISYEKYFADNKGYLAAAYFYGALRSYIYTQTIMDYDFSAQVAGYMPPPGTPPNTPPVQRFGNLSLPLNGKGGKLQGLELSASVPLDMLTPALQGFGVIASASFTDSSIKVFDPESATSVGSGPISLPGLSKRVFNLTAYYARDGFEARISQRRRSDFIGEIGNFNGTRTLRYVVGEEITDAQVSYAFGPDTSLNNLSLLLQVTNLTNEPYQTYAGSKDRPLEYIEYGRTYLVGLNYKF